MTEIRVVDVAAQAREAFGSHAEAIAGRPLPEHDFRFEAVTATGAQVTFHAGATAEHIATYLKERDDEDVTTPQHAR